MSTQPFDPAEYKAGQRQEWGAAADGCRRQWETIEAFSQPVSDRLVELAQIRPGHRVLDVATGIGEPAATAARAVGQSGSVVATDQAPEMLAIAQERVVASGLQNIEFREMDAETLDLPVEERTGVVKAIEEAVAQYAAQDGTIRIPNEAICVAGHKV